MDIQRKVEVLPFGHDATKESCRPESGTALGSNHKSNISDKFKDLQQRDQVISVTDYFPKLNKVESEDLKSVSNLKTAHVQISLEGREKQLKRPSGSNVMSPSFGKNTPLPESSSKRTNPKDLN